MIEKMTKGIFTSIGIVFTEAPKHEMSYGLLVDQEGATDLNIKERSHETVLGELIAYYFEFFESDPETQPFARTIASREQVKRSTGSWAINKKGEMTKLKDNDED